MYVRTWFRIHFQNRHNLVWRVTACVKTSNGIPYNLVLNRTPVVCVTRPISCVTDKSQTLYVPQKDVCQEIKSVFSKEEKLSCVFTPVSRFQFFNKSAVKCGYFLKIKTFNLMFALVIRYLRPKINIKTSSNTVYKCFLFFFASHNIKQFRFLG